ncbi:MAG: hypothetical protein QM497_09335 [Sulfurimonas sp.]
MKSFLVFLVFSIFFAGCSEKSAFSRFNMSEKQELGVDSLMNSKVREGNRVEGVVSVIYLNKIFPETYQENEFFYIYMYLKNRNNKLNFILNNEKAISVEKLPVKNEFNYLTSIDTKWNKYYLVKFKKQGDILKFLLESGQSSSDLLVFEKDE